MVGAISLTATSVAQKQPVGELFASDASVRGSMMMTSSGTQVMSGSQVTAGEHVAVLRLTRGGEVRICRGTSLAVSQPSPAAPMLFGINTGSMEIHYKLAAIADSVVTPDFSIQLTGPGTFHVALGADAKGNTCVRTLEGNTAAVIVQESMGNGSYQVAPGHSVKFAEGKLEKASESNEVCGCPEVKPAPVVMAKVAIPKNEPLAAVIPEKPPTTPAAVDMDAPLVFKGSSPMGESVEKRLARESYTIVSVRVVPLAITPALIPSSMPKVEKQKVHKAAESKRGFFGSIGKFFSKVFGR